ncbi:MULTISPECIES: response regulator transcription factor [Nitrincola]|uniref:Transcriptional regulatory protein fixJ n=1 Tax=Nitrincola nitratireducens TaxID=1229521 RepID=W9V2A5_9GAMM|nr:MULTISPECIES: response regulator [Nitrincola]EXJ11076.1 Transcriptional regulatory protein fixJ [Nitrincola nitratireducens]
MSQNNKTVFLVDDDQDFRDSMCWLLESAGYIVKHYDSADRFLHEYDLSMGCLLLDVRMPGTNGLALQQILAEKHIPLPIILISGHGDIPMAVNAIKAGALDFIEKPFDDKLLLSLVEKGLTEAQQRFASYKEEQKIFQHYDQLSGREKEVMSLVTAGNANREIAEILKISPKTVEVHRARVMSKMHAENLPELVNMSTLLKQYGSLLS